MDALLLIYNLILVVLYSSTILLAILVYMKTKNKFYPYLITLFGIYIVDSLILYLADFVVSFSNFYKAYFIDVPTLKTIVYSVSFICILKMTEYALNTSIPVWLYILFVSVIIFLLFVPGIDNSVIKLWLYFIPASIFGLVTGIFGLIRYRRIPDESHTIAQRYFRYALCIMILSSLAIFIEDSVSILHYTSYKELTQRNISEDIMSILFSLLALTYLFRQFEIAAQPVNEEAMEKSIKLSAKEKKISGKEEKISEKSIVTITKPTENQANSFESSADEATEPLEFSKFFLFCKEYQLTSREQDIMSLLLKNMNNEEISDSLKISLGTTKTHIHNIYTKLNVKKRRQLLEEYQNFHA